MLSSLVLVAALGAPVPCHVAGVGRAWPVTVAPDGAEPFALELGGMRVEVTLGEAGASVRGVSPLAFEGRATLAAVPLGVRRAQWVTPFVYTSEQTWLVPRALRDDGVEVDIDVPDARPEPITVPCSRLALRPAEREEPIVEQGLVTFEGSVLSLQSRPDRGAVYSVVLPEARLVRLHELAKRQGWARLEARWSDGTKVRGWTPSDALRHDLVGRIGGLSAMGHGCGLRTGRTLSVGTAVHAAPDGPRWATVTSPIGVEVDASVPGWWRVVRMPGVGSDERCGPIAPVVWVRAGGR